eukprot:702842-Pleurochrysis_carterae.AAC.3
MGVSLEQKQAAAVALSGTRPAQTLPSALYPVQPLASAGTGFAHPRTQTRTYTFTHPPGSGSFIHEVMANFVLHAKHRSALATPKH